MRNKKYAVVSAVVAVIMCGSMLSGCSSAASKGGDATCAEYMKMSDKDQTKAITLPTPLTDEELDALVEAEVAKVRAAGETPTMKHMGALVKAVNAAAAGRAPGAEVAARVKAAILG